MFLVTGASGNVGRHVVAGLRERGHTVRGLHRRPAGPDTVRGDLTDPGSLDAAFLGVTGFSLLVLPGVDAAAVLDVARRRGVRRVVLISSGAVVDGVDEQPNPVAAMHAVAERAVRESGLAWTILRPRWFAANSLWWAPALRAGRPVRGAYPDAVSAPIHEADIAEVAVAALAGAGQDGSVHVLTGPEILTQAEQVRVLAAVTGRPAEFERITSEQARADLLRSAPAPVVDTLLAQQAGLTAADIRLSDAVEAVTGHRPRTFRQWAGEHRAAFT